MAKQENMNPTVEYKMSQDDLDILLESCKDVPCIMIGDVPPSSPQENTNRAWSVLGKKMGFDSITVRPSQKGGRFFTAVPSETKPQKQERMKRDEISSLNSDVATLARTIKELGSVVDELLTRLQKLEKGKQ